MPGNLQQQLLAYSSCLIVMQRLEGRHHIVSQAMAHGRAAQPPAVVADLRRRFNNDLRDPKFRVALPQLLERFSELTPSPWESRADLIRHIYGFGLEELHADMTTAQQVVQRFSDMVAGARVHVQSPHADAEVGIGVLGVGGYLFASVLFM